MSKDVVPEFRYTQNLSDLLLNQLQCPKKYTAGLIKLCVQFALRCTKTNEKMQMK